MPGISVSHSAATVSGALVAQADTRSAGGKYHVHTAHHGSQELQPQLLGVVGQQPPADLQLPQPGGEEGLQQFLDARAGAIGVAAGRGGVAQREDQARQRSGTMLSAVSRPQDSAPQYAREQALGRHDALADTLGDAHSPVRDIPCRSA